MNNLKTAKTSSVARRAVIYIALCSIMIAILITSVQVWRDYIRITADIGREFKQIGELYIKSITDGVWVTDTRRLQILIEGMTSLRDIRYVAIYENGKPLVSTGEKPKDKAITKTYPLQYRFRGQDLLLGTLEVIIDAKGAEQRVFERSLEILANNAIETLAVVIFLYLILHNLVIRHLTAIAGYLQSIKPDIKNPPLKLARNRKNNGTKDELDLVASSINDLSDRVTRAFDDIRKAQAAQKISEQRFRDYALSSSDWFWEMDRDLNLVFLSRKYKEVTGFDPEHALGKPRNLVAVENTDTEKWKQHLDTLQQHQPFRGFCYDLDKADGGVITVSVSGNPVFDKNGNFTGYRGTTTDISEHRRAEKARDMALIEAEQANQAKSEFLATMSHEFRTPLNAILGFSEMLRSQYFGPLGADNYKDYANDIHNSGEHMLMLVNDVLDISAIEAGKREIAKEDVDLQVLITDAIRKISKQADDADITISLDIPQDLPVLHADKRSVTQIVLNVLSNAVKYTGENGEIRLSAENLGDHIQVTITDTGVGIDPDKLENITDPFYQAGNGAHTAHAGTGLGLAIVKSLVEAHDGRLEITSTLGEGTTVTIILPV